MLGVTVDMSLKLMHGFPQRLAARGWDVHVVCAPGIALEELSRHQGITTHAIPMKREPAILSDLRSLWQWFWLMKQVGPDIVSVGTPKAALLGGMAALLARVPARVYTLRGLRLETTFGHKRRVLAVIERIAIASSKRVIAVSSSLRDRAIELKLVDPNKIVTLGHGSSNGVEVARFEDARFDPRDIEQMKRELKISIGGPPVIGFVGRLTADKGLSVLAEARFLLVERGIDHQLLVVGNVDDESGMGEADGLRQAGRSPIFVGAVDDTAPYFQMMDLLCLPTLREGFPNVVLEASASGIPTVTTTATGAIDSVLDGETGIVAEVGSAKELAVALERLLLSEELRRRLGKAARQRVSKDFDRRDVWDRTEAYYLSLVGGDTGVL